MTQETILSARDKLHRHRAAGIPLERMLVAAPYQRRRLYKSSRTPSSLDCCMALCQLKLVKMVQNVLFDLLLPLLQLA